jgi:putative ABC transport system permease protein
MKRSLRSWLWRVPLDQEVDDEIAFHLDMRTRELVDRGMDPIKARQMAARRLGDLATLRQTCMDLGRKRDRDMRITQWLDELRDDVKFAVRQLRRSPGFALVAAITLALGIGANGAIFALVDAALLRPLPFRNPDRLVMLWERSEGTPHDGVSPLNLDDWNSRNRSFDRIGGFVPSVGGMVMAGADGSAETVPRQWVSAGVFDALGVTPIVGRTFLPSDDQRRANVVVLSEAFWQTRFNRDRSVIGRDLRLDGTPYTVVGVVPNTAEVIGRTSIWAMVSFHGAPPAARGAHVLQALGRLKPGVSLDAATSDLTAVAAGLAREFPKTNKGRSVTLEPMHEAVIGSDLRVTSMLFVGVVGFVLLMCCANVANLLLARATVRTRELAIRSALGAGRRRVIRQLLTESLVLSTIGGALGAAVGAAIVSVAPGMIPAALLPGAVSLTFDLRVVIFCAVTALIVGILFGLAPAWQATNLSSTPVIAADSRTVTGRGGRFRSVLVVGEVATAVLLLFGAGLLLRTLLVVENVDPGYRARSVLTMMVDPLGRLYPTDSALLQFFESIEREVGALPGVRSLAWSSTLPLGPSDGGERSFEIVGGAPVDARQRPVADYEIVSPAYFSTLDLPIVAGRGFTAEDRADSVPVCMVNEAFVKHHFRGGSPIGQRVALRPPESPEAEAGVKEIVGVAAQVKARPDETEDVVQIYVPMAQHPTDDIYLVVRPTSGSAAALASSVRSAIGRVDKEQLVSVRDVMTLEDVAWDATARHRFRAVMVITFAALALLLAMVGVFGILAYSVQLRVRDFAVRRALGATTGDVLRMVMRSAVGVIGLGAVIGLALAAALSRVLTTLLFGVQPLDVMTFVAVALVLTLTAALAVAGPAWRATRIDPASALRSE